MSNTPSQILEDYGEACMDYVADRYIEVKTGKKFLAHAPRTEAAVAQLDAYYRDKYSKAFETEWRRTHSPSEFSKDVEDCFKTLRAALEKDE